MNKGKIEEINFADEIYKNPKQDYTRKLIEAIPKGDLEDIRHAMMDRKVKKMEKIRRRRREQRKGGES
jgi:peptide/nickel transport system ATP-binding protein